MTDEQEDIPDTEHGDSEKSPCILENDVVYTSDDIIENISRNRTWKFNLYVIWLMLNWVRGPPITYLTSFAGNIVVLTRILKTGEWGGV